MLVFRSNLPSYQTKKLAGFVNSKVNVNVRSRLVPQRTYAIHFNHFPQNKPNLNLFGTNKSLYTRFEKKEVRSLWRRYYSVSTGSRRVVSFHYKLTDPSGKPLDASSTHPFSFLEGAGQIIPGLEKHIQTMNPGDKATVRVPWQEAYGARNPDLLWNVPKSKLPSQTVKVGDQFDHTDHVLTVKEVHEDHVILDANHPLAEVDLLFEVQLVDTREATEEEISHGHAHGPGGHHHH
eukprot:TRINITY_DN3027_c0_g1_i1.p1 TRINITY_DN3027_c0_g1~~TRINITY_DN3027_c0_g1_i1.p1  ORF type:complete len:235 (-),score=55.55 TRINITY_DN3027_c0_g1_i1:157-861(-)